MSFDQGEIFVLEILKKFIQEKFFVSLWNLRVKKKQLKIFFEFCFFLGRCQKIFHEKFSNIFFGNFCKEKKIVLNLKFEAFLFPFNKKNLSKIFMEFFIYLKFSKYKSNINEEKDFF